MDNFTSKTKQHRVLGINLLRISSIVLLISVGVNAGTRTDTLYTSGGAYLTRVSTPSAGITRANIDTSKTRHATSDSATIPVFKGAKTIRDTSTFTGGAYFAGIARFAGTLYAPVADIDSLIGNVSTGGSITLNQSGDAIQSGLNLKSNTGNSYWRIASISTGKLYISRNSTSFTTIDSNGVFTHSGTLTTSTLNTDSIKINGGSWLNTYVTGTFACTLKTSDVTVQQIGTAYWTKIGDVMTISFPYLTGTSNSTNLRVYCHIPFNPKQLVYGSPTCYNGVMARDNGNPVNCYTAIPETFGYISINIASGAGFTNSGIKSLFPFSAQFITEN